MGEIAGTAGAGASPDDAMGRRQAVLADIDRRDILATPANSAINELVTEAARLSIAHNGRAVAIDCAATELQGL